MKKYLFTFIMIVSLTRSYGQDQTFYPCQLGTVGNTYTIQISDRTSLDFQKIWEEFGYSGNGYTWEGLIRQFMKKDKLNIRVEFESEGGLFFAQLKNREDQLRLAKYIRDLCADKKKFREYVKNANRSLIDD